MKVFKMNVLGIAALLPAISIAFTGCSGKGSAGSPSGAGAEPSGTALEAAAETGAVLPADSAAEAVFGEPAGESADSADSTAGAPASGEGTAPASAGTGSGTGAASGTAPAGAASPSGTSSGAAGASGGTAAPATAQTPPSVPGPPLTWKEINNLPVTTHTNFSGLAFGSGKFVVAGYARNGGNLSYSADGVTWRLAENRRGGDGGTSNYGLAYGGGKFVAVGTAMPAAPTRTIAYSQDGITWTAVENNPLFDAGKNPSDNDVYSVAYGGGRFVAGGAEGKAGYSADGVTWTAAPIGPFIDKKVPVTCLAYGGGKFIAAGGIQGSNAFQLAYSRDGVSWTEAANPFGAGEIQHITYGNGKFVMAGFVRGTGSRLAYSADGVTWTVAALPGVFTDPIIVGMAYGGGYFVANTGVKLLYSQDGINWTEIPNHPFPAGEGTRRVFYAGGIFFVVGTNELFEGSRLAYSNRVE